MKPPFEYTLRTVYIYNIQQEQTTDSYHTVMHSQKERKSEFIMKLYPYMT